MFKTPAIRSLWSSLLAVTVIAVLCVNGYWYFTWRIDQPPENPGGPLGSLGYGVKLWSLSVMLAPIVIGPLTSGVVRYLTRRGAEHSQAAESALINFTVFVLIVPILLPRPCSLWTAVGVPVLLLLGWPAILRGFSRRNTT